MSETKPKPLELPWTVRILLSILSFSVDISRRSNGSVNRFIMTFFDFKSTPSSKPVKGVKASDIVVDTARNLWFRLFVPTPSASTSTSTVGDVSMPVIFFFHGGGFVYLGANSKPYDDFCRRLARKLQAITISVNYRLAPETRYPGQIEDGFDVLKFVDEIKSSDGLLPPKADLKQCFMAGDSAGGNLAHHLVHKASEYNFKNIDIRGVIVIQPFIGGEERVESENKLAGASFVTVERTDWIWKAYLPEGSNRDHEASNVFGPNAVDISEVKFPATMVFVGGYDPLIDWQKKYYEGLKRHGKEVYLVEYPNAIHSFYIFPQLPESSLLIEELREFIRKQSTP